MKVDPKALKGNEASKVPQRRSIAMMRCREAIERHEDRWRCVKTQQRVREQKRGVQGEEKALKGEGKAFNCNKNAFN